LSGPRDLVVRRRVLAWSPRWRGRDLADVPGGWGDSSDGGSSGDGGLDVDMPGGGGFGLLDLLDDFIVGALVAIAIVLVIATVVPVVVLAVEVVLLLMMTSAVLIGRIVLRHPWPVEARDRATGEIVGTWQVVGWRRAGRACEDITQRAAFGAALPPPGPWDPDSP